MLRPLLEEMRVFLAPGRLGLARVRRGPVKQVLETTTIHPAGSGIDDLAVQLADKDLPARVYLSNHLVRLLALPWQDSLDSEAEWQAFASHALGRAFGEPASGGRRVRMARQGYGQQVIAASIAEDMHAALQQVVEQGGRRLRSLEPWCLAALDLHRRELPRDCWFFAAEAGMIAGMQIAAGIVQSITMHPVGSDWHGGVAEAIAREIAKQGGDSALPVFLHAAQPVTLDASVLAGIKVRLLASGRDAELGIV